MTPLMNWVAEHFERRYAPNSREAVRRQTLHQFVEASLVVLNPDDPSRPINSRYNVYQVDATAHALLRRFGTPMWERSLPSYLQERPGQQAAYAAVRDLAMIPVTLPDGARVKLTPGGQNVLIREILEHFCPRWTPGGRVLYVGDAARTARFTTSKGLPRMALCSTGTASCLTL